MLTTLKRLNLLWNKLHMNDIAQQTQINFYKFGLSVDGQTLFLMFRATSKGLRLSIFLNAYRIHSVRQKKTKVLCKKKMVFHPLVRTDAEGVKSIYMGFCCEIFFQEKKKYRVRTRNIFFLISFILFEKTLWEQNHNVFALQ